MKLSETRSMPIVIRWWCK